MARWRLRKEHYIFAKQFGEDTEYEYKEIDRITGRERHQRFKVPLYCDTGSIVCRPGFERDDRDIIYEGPPTPDMEPLDDAAKAETAKYQKSWVHPIEGLEGNFSSEVLLAHLNKQISNLVMSAAPALAAPATGVSREEFDALQGQLAALLAQNAELMAKQKPKAERRA